MVLETGVLPGAGAGAGAGDGAGAGAGAGAGFGGAHVRARAEEGVVEVGDAHRRVVARRARGERVGAARLARPAVAGRVAGRGVDAVDLGGAGAAVEHVVLEEVAHAHLVEGRVGLPQVVDVVHRV